MTPPELTAGYLLWSAALGLILGIVYAFLAPLRKKLLSLADGIFVLTTFCLWIYFSFAICGGSLRVGYWAGFAAGGFFSYLTLGRLFAPTFALFWRCVFAFLSFPLKLLKKTLKKFTAFTKKLLAYGKKSSTIRTNRPRTNRHKGGRRYGKTTIFPSEHPLSLQADTHDRQNCDSVRNYIVYGSPSNPALENAGRAGPSRRSAAVRPRVRTRKAAAARQD
jgi:hypothetical protein